MIEVASTRDLFNLPFTLDLCVLFTYNDEKIPDNNQDDEDILDDESGWEGA